MWLVTRRGLFFLPRGTPRALALLTSHNRVLTPPPPPCLHNFTIPCAILFLPKHMAGLECLRTTLVQKCTIKMPPPPPALPLYMHIEKTFRIHTPSRNVDAKTDALSILPCAYLDTLGLPDPMAARLRLNIVLQKEKKKKRNKNKGENTQRGRFVQYQDGKRKKEKKMGARVFLCPHRSIPTLTKKKKKRAHNHSKQQL